MFVHNDNVVMNNRCPSHSELKRSEAHQLIERIERNIIRYVC